MSKDREYDAYREWAAPLASCILTGRPAHLGGVDMCHLRWFTGMAKRPPASHCLPIIRELHRYQENDRDFLPSMGVENPITEAQELYAIYQVRDPAWFQSRIEAIHSRVDRMAVERILRSAA